MIPNLEVFFLTNKSFKESIITGPHHQKHLMNNKDSLFKSINKINSVKFKINKELLYYLNNDGKFILKHYFL
jgi:hypothetical protein